MAGRIRKRYVETPDGTRWIVERHWLARRPRYIGYRFRVKRREQEWEPPLVRQGEALPEIHRPKPAGPVPRPYRDNPDLATADRRGRSSGGGWWWGDWSFGWPRGGSGGSSGRGRSGGSRGGGSRGGSRGGGTRSLSRGGGGRSSSRSGPDWGDAVGWVLIAIAVVLAALFVVFVLIPSLLFVAQYLLFWLLVAGWIVYNTITGRPWVVKATREGYEEPDHAYRIKGWRNSHALIDDIADDLRRGEPPVPSEVAVEVELIED